MRKLTATILTAALVAPAAPANANPFEGGLEFVEDNWGESALGGGTWGTQGGTPAPEAPAPEAPAEAPEAPAQEAPAEAPEDGHERGVEAVLSPEQRGAAVFGHEGAASAREAAPSVPELAPVTTAADPANVAAPEATASVPVVARVLVVERDELPEGADGEMIWDYLQLVNGWRQLDAETIVSPAHPRYGHAERNPELPDVVFTRPVALDGISERAAHVLVWEAGWTQVGDSVVSPEWVAEVGLEF